MKKIVNRMLLLLILTGCLWLSATTNLAYAAPSSYFDILLAPTTNYVLNQDISSTIWFDVGCDTPVDETNTQLTITGGSFQAEPFIRSYEDRGDLLIEILTENGYMQIWHQQNGWSSDLFTNGFYTIGSWADGYSLRKYENAANSFVFVTNLSNDDSVPVVNGWEGVYFTNINNPVTLSQIRSLLKAFDNEDGDISANIVVVSDNYTTNQNILGQYPIVFGVSDSAGNQATITINIRIIDASAPVINGPDSVDSYQSNPLTTAAILALYSVEDNYDDNLSVVIKSDGYSPNKNTFGQYPMTLQVTDLSGNKSEKNITIYVRDDIKPQISGEANYTRGSEGILLESTIRSGLIANDNVDGIITNRIILVSDSYSSSNNKAGNYTLTYQVKDNANNLSEIFTVHVLINDTIPPVFYVDIAIIHIDDSLALTHDQIITFLVETGQIEEGMREQSQIISDTYQGTKNPGTYQLTIEIKNSDGSTKMAKLTIQVLKQEPTPILLKPWYSTWKGWVSKWFGARFIYDFIVKTIRWLL